MKTSFIFWGTITLVIIWLGMAWSVGGTLISWIFGG